MGLLDSILFLFAIVDAPGNLPIFIELTRDMSPAMRRRVYDVATVAGFVLIVVFSVAGRWVLAKVFQISVSEFQIAGGVLLVAVGVHAMVSEGSDGARKGSRGLEIAAVPMACPLLVGPGAIVTTMLIVERYGLPHALLAGAIVFALVRAIFWLAGPIARLVGNLGLLILSRLMRIFIVAIGIHFVVAGIRAVFQLGR